MPQVSLQSKDHEELLNTIDQLRAQGISRYIDLPQLIVCGDQSSGKSSVLEAVSGLRFPIKDNLCTRFATELILRRGPEEGAAATIVPGTDRSEADVKKLRAFQPATVNLDDFASLVAGAGEAMGLDQNPKAFSNDVLRVEITGPKQPHLTLVDLPGLFWAGNKVQSVEDADSVRKLVLSYMRRSRSIILAVISAKNDLANQIVTKHARDLDPLGLRTLGIITKPDTLPAGSDSERAFVELARNKDVNFRLGWHVLRNRGYDMRDCTAEERDETEEKFFSQGIWTSLSPSQLGIGTLKPRLSRVLKDQILLELPGLIEDVESGVVDCEDRLERLGAPRTTLHDQKTHLIQKSQAFSTLVKSATDGLYNDEFFGDPHTEDGYSKRLRAVATNILRAFADEIEKRGHARKIVEGVKKSFSFETGGLFAQNGTRSTGLFGTGTSAPIPFRSGGSGNIPNPSEGPSEGTGSAPFKATREGEANGGLVDHQSIAFQPPYQKYAFEELRLADYHPGQRSGNVKQKLKAGTFIKQNPPEISRDEYILEVKQLIERTRGCELPGTYNPQIVGELFFAQSKPWQSIVEATMHKLLDAARTMLNLALEYTCDQKTAEGLLHIVINPSMDSVKQLLELKTAELLEPHQRGHPITYDHALTDSIQKARQSEWSAKTESKVRAFFGTSVGSTGAIATQSVNIDDLLESLSLVAKEVDMDRHICSEAIDCMQAYYEVARRSLVDNFCVLSIEKCLLQKLPGLFCPEVVFSLDDAATEAIAAETEESKMERAASTRKMEILEASLKVLRSLDRHKPHDVPKIITQESEDVAIPAAPAEKRPATTPLRLKSSENRQSASKRLPAFEAPQSKSYSFNMKMPTPDATPERSKETVFAPGTPEAEIDSPL